MGPIPQTWDPNPRKLGLQSPKLGTRIPESWDSNPTNLGPESPNPTNLGLESPIPRIWDSNPLFLGLVFSKCDKLWIIPLKINIFIFLEFHFLLCCRWMNLEISSFNSNPKLEILNPSNSPRFHKLIR